MSENVLYETQDGIGRVTFNRPEARNAFTLAMYERLYAIVQEAQEDRSIRVLVLTGAGEKAFAAGTDISEFRAFSTAEDALGYEGKMDRVLGALERSNIPTIAAIGGVCTGGGRRLRLAAIFGLGRRTRGSGCRSRGRWGIACRWQTMCDWQLC